LPVLCGRGSRPTTEPEAKPKAPKPEEKEVPASGAEGGASWLPAAFASKKDATDSEAKAEPELEKTDDSANAGGVAGNFLGAGVKQILGAFDASTLGVKVELGALHLDPLFGKVEIGGLTIDNPEGYHSEYALKAERLCIEIDLKKLVWSCGKDIDIKEASLQGVDVIFEKALFTSNLSQIVKDLQGEQGEKKKEAPAEPAAPASDSTKTEAPTVTLHRVAVENVGAKLTSKLTRGKGMRLEVGNIIYEDFATECGAGRAAADVIRVLLMTIVKSILTTILGKNSTKSLDRSSSTLSSKKEACEEKDNKAPEDASKQLGPSSIFSLCKRPQASTDVETLASPQAAAAGA